MYLWERKDWPDFRWDAGRLLVPLAVARHQQGRLLGQMLRLGFPLRIEAQARAMTEEALRTSEIEGEVLDKESVRSSVARHLGLPQGGVLDTVDRRVEGLVEMMLDATSKFAEPLTPRRLGGWHASLFPGGYSGLRRVRVGRWRNDAAGPMQVVSGPVGRTKVHYQAPAAEQVPVQMRRFLEWFNGPPIGDGLVRAAVAHLWFVTVHPFEDGNGRIARALTDMALAQLEQSSQRFYSLSSQIRRERGAYYDVLESTQKGSLEVTDWLVWFLGCYARAIDGAAAACQEVLARADFWERFAREPLTPRQKQVLGRVLEGFEGKLTTKKWAALGKCSIDTAQRDINDLLGRGILLRNPGGSRRTSYSVALGGPAPSE